MGKAATEAAISRVIILIAFTLRCSRFFQANLFGSRSRQHSAHHGAAPSVATRTVNHVTRDSRVRFKTKHLPAHWFHFDRLAAMHPDS
jgi:hypothetical protein